MQFFPKDRFHFLSWACTFLFSTAAWSVSFSLPILRPGAGLFFAAATCLSAALGISQALVAILLNAGAMNLFFHLYQPESWWVGRELWSILPVVPALIVGYARQRWSAAEMLAGHLRKDLARMRDELELLRADLKRFNDLSLRLASNVEPRRLLNELLSWTASLHKTDLALLLLLPEKSSKVLRVETSTGFTAEQIKLFGEFTTAFFSLERRVLIENMEESAVYFRFVDTAMQAGLRAMLSMPVSNAKGEPLGVLVTLFRRPHSPNSRQLRLTELYARQAASALDIARLYRDSMETLAAEQHRSAVLRSLAEASVQINSALSLDSLLQTITDWARDIIGASQASTTLLPKGTLDQSMTCSSVAKGQAMLEFPQTSSEMFMLACTLNKPVRLNAGTKGSPPWRDITRKDGAARHGWLAAPLLTRDGRNLGLIQLAGKINGQFTADDEVLLVQLAHTASVAIDNARLYGEAREQLAETKRAQEALERNKETMQLAQQCVGIGTWEWDLVTGALVWSDDVRRLHGFAGTFDGRYESWMQSIHPEDRHQVQQSVNGAIAAQAEYEVEYRVVFADGSIHWLEARGRTMALNKTALRMLCVVMDISARKSAEEALRASEKVAETARLAAAIAHEINNPLSVVTNVLYILRTSPHLVGAGLDHVKTAEAELKRVVHITKHMLGFYRELATPEMASIPSLLDGVLEAYRDSIEKARVRIDKQYLWGGQFMGFPGGLRLVFSALILNALEAVPAGGIVSIRLRETRHSRAGNGLKIIVADNGPGIPKAVMSRLFEIFVTTKRAKGTGLGLWVSQGIVKRHGGSIRVRSWSGANHGTCFSIFLPLAEKK
jgi:PAS domain S-box-containing protein